MKVNVLLFGQLTDITGTGHIILETATNTDELLVQLQNTYPALQHCKYIISVDKKLITTNTMLADGCTVALLPPFSGG